MPSFFILVLSIVRFITFIEWNWPGNMKTCLPCRPVDEPLVAAGTDPSRNRHVSLQETKEGGRYRWTTSSKPHKAVGFS